MKRKLEDTEGSFFLENPSKMQPSPAGVYYGNNVYHATGTSPDQIGRPMLASTPQASSATNRMQRRLTTQQRQRYHKDDPNFSVACSIGSCSFTSRKWSTFRSHVSRKHDDINQDVDLPHPPMLNDDGENDAIPFTDTEALKNQNALYTLSLQAKHNIMAVLENDGTEVDEDEVLVELTNKDLLMVLTPGQSWSAASVDHTLEPAPTHEPEPTPEPTMPTAKMPERPEYTIFLQQEHPTNSKIELDSSLDSSVCDTPQFSALIRQHLQTNGDYAIELVWNKFIGEAANFYCVRNPDTSTAYQKIGQQMYEKYPCIKQEGAFPWSFFIKSLSQKIRHMRLNLKRKSQTVVSPRGQKTMKVVASSSSTMVQSTISSEQDEKGHIEELQDEWKKPVAKRNKSHIRTLLRETKTARALLLKSSTRILKEVIDSFPCFQDGEYVLYEMKQTLKPDKFNQVLENMEVLVRACHNLMGTPLGPNDLNEDKQEAVAIDDRIMKAMQYVEQETKFDRSKKGKKHFLSTIKIHDSDDVPARLKTSEGDPPAVVLFQDEDGAQYSGAYIVGDDVSILLYNNCIMVHMLQLLGVYYIFDLDYPKQYAMFLGVLQQFVMNDQFTRESSKRFKFFCKKLRPEFEKEKADSESRTIEN